MSNKKIYYEGLIIDDSPEIIDLTNGGCQVVDAENINPVISANINQFKQWTRNNFYFEHNIVRYLHDDTQYLSKFPIAVEDPVIYEKDRFDTPFSHLLYFAFIVGKKMQIDESEKILDMMAKDPTNFIGKK